MKERIQALSKYLDGLYKLALLGVLVWIGYSLQEIASTIYSGPSSYSDDVMALKEIAAKLEDIKRAIPFR